MPDPVPLLDPDFEFRESDNEIVDHFLTEHPEVVQSEETEWEE
jgi:hypothetical protein